MGRENCGSGEASALRPASRDCRRPEQFLRRAATGEAAGLHTSGSQTGPVLLCAALVRRHFAHGGTSQGQRAVRREGKGRPSQYAGRFVNTQGARGWSFVAEPHPAAPPQTRPSPCLQSPRTWPDLERPGCSGGTDSERPWRRQRPARGGGPGTAGKHWM